MIDLINTLWPVIGPLAFFLICRACRGPIAEMFHGALDERRNTYR